jgi:hypothetical protein
VAESESLVFPHENQELWSRRVHAWLRITDCPPISTQFPCHSHFATHPHLRYLYRVYSDGGVGPGNTLLRTADRIALTKSIIDRVLDCGRLQSKGLTNMHLALHDSSREDRVTTKSLSKQWTTYWSQKHTQHVTVSRAARHLEHLGATVEREERFLERLRALASACERLRARSLSPPPLGAHTRSLLPPRGHPPLLLFFLPHTTHAHCRSRTFLRNRCHPGCFSPPAHLVCPAPPCAHARLCLGAPACSRACVCRTPAAPAVNVQGKEPSPVPFFTRPLAQPLDAVRDYFGEKVRSTVTVTVSRNL